MSLEQIYEEMGPMTARQLHIAVLQAGGSASMKQVRDFIARKPEQQTFKQGNVSKGKEATREPDSTLIVDLIDMYARKSNGFTAILITINPWSRKISLQPLTNKKAATVTEAFKRALAK